MTVDRCDGTWTAKVFPFSGTWYPKFGIPQDERLQEYDGKLYTHIPLFR